jgi:hypothetical protein
MIKQLADPELYIASAERVRARQQRTNDVRPLTPHGPRLAALGTNLDGLARRLARDVKAGRYAFSPVQPRLAYIEGKLRALYLATPLDDIVLGALAQVLSEACEPTWSAHLHSYRRGRSPWSAIDAFRGYVRAHRAERPDPRTRGLFVLRRDVRAYGDAIGVDAESRLWLQLADALRRADIEPTPPLLAWLRSAFRPALETETGPERFEWPTRGVPTGSPLQPIACNLYLSPLDQLCEQVPGAFYARYGDDVLFAHPDAGVVESCMPALDACIAALGLELNADKCAAYYFTGAGRASPARAFRGVSGCDYLGVRVDFRGSTTLKRDKLHDLLDDVQQRLARSVLPLRAADAAGCAAGLCRIVNAALDPAHPLSHPSASALRMRVDDRGQLRDLDYKLARLVAQTLSGRPGVRAFRSHPPRVLREQAGLVSLVRERDRAAVRAHSRPA